MTATGIVKAVCDCYGIEEDELLCRVKDRYLVDARIMASYLMRFKLGYSLGKIGLVMKRDHSTVAHYITTHRSLMERDAKYAGRFRELSKGM